MRDAFDREIRYLRLSVTELCNLRCRYCMPGEGICKKNHEEMLTEEEMVRAVTAGASLGIQKVRVTGGEPLVKKNIVSICRRIKAVDGIQELCVTTNGLLLPGLADDLREAGVDRLNLSLDTLDEAKYAYITRCGVLRDALRGLEAALNAGFERIKINAVLMGGFNDGEIPALAGLTRKYPVDVRFIELMPMGEREGLEIGAYISASEVLRRLPQAVKQEHDDGVARLYRLPDAQGNIGLISPVSDHFCALCNRVRLTADGNLKPCLHCAEEFPIKGLDMEGMREQFQRAIAAKPGCHAELSAYRRSMAGRDMNRIGG